MNDKTRTTTFQKARFSLGTDKYSLFHRLSLAQLSLSLFLSNSTPNMQTVIHQKEVCYRLRIWHLNLTHKKRARGQLRGMVTYHPLDVTPQSKDGHPPEGSILYVAL